MQTSFEGVWVPIITPFQGDDIDHAALARLAQHFAQQGITGLVAGATTGEGALLKAGEQEAIFWTLRQAVAHMPIVLGISTASTEMAVLQARSLASVRPDGLLVTAPTYVRPSQEGIRKHIEAVVAAADLPVLIYNIPYRTGVNVEVETLQMLARDTRVAGIKECGGSNERMLRLVCETPLSILSGDDSQNFAALCLGAHGSIAASAHILPQWHVRMRDLIISGQLAAARRIAAALAPLIASLFAEPNPAPLKTLLADQQWCSPSLRLPFVPASPALREQLQRHWHTLQALSF